MASSRTVIDAASPKLPTGLAGSVAVPNAAALTSAAVIDLSAYSGQYVTFSCTGAWRPRVSSTVVAAQTTQAATAGDAPFKADTQYSFQVQISDVGLSVYGDAAGTLKYWVSS